MINRIKGTKDVNPDEMLIYEFIRNVFLNYSCAFNFNFIETPVIEAAELYKRSVSESDIVKKEMYEFIDKGERNIALRPEGTAGFIRAVVENKWYSTLNTTKFSYFGPMFRYEQPQKGRQRQFYQGGVEYIGDKNPIIDFELISLAQLILNTLGLKTKLKINTIGDETSRHNYQEALKKYLLPYKDQLTELSQERLNKNVLRILDDKIDGNKEFVTNAPKIQDHLTLESKKYFNDVLALLKENNIEYEIDNRLVRGLDYYDEIVYEFVSIDKNVGSQATIIGGGRYSKLLNELGGPQISSSGWAIGIDRAAQILMENSEFMKKFFAEKVSILIAYTNQKNANKLISLTNELRSYKIKCEILKNESKSKKIFDKANKLNADFVIFDDLYEENKTFLVKHLISNDKIRFNYDENGFIDLLEFLSENGLDELNNLEINDEEE